MQFLYPSFLWALLALAIPIIIHLFYFRRFKRVYFTNVKFLKEVKEETSARRKVRNLLVLLSRLFAIAMLVFAFAQPYFKKNEIGSSQGEKLVSVYFDNSFSMNNVAQEFTLLDKAKEQAENVANLYNQSDKFQLITNDFELKHQRFVTRQEFIDLVQEVTTSSVTRKLTQVEQKQLDFLNKEGSQNKFGYYISDFQKSTIGLIEAPKEMDWQIKLIKIAVDNVSNIYVDTAYIEVVQIYDAQKRIRVLLKNSGNKDRKAIQLKLISGQQLISTSSVDIKAGSESIVILSFFKMMLSPPCPSSM